ARHHSDLHTFPTRRSSDLGNRTLFVVRKQLPLSYTSNKIQRRVLEPWLKVIQTAGESYHQNGAVPGEQSYHRRFVHQNPITEPLAVARKLKRHLVEGHAAEERSVGGGNDGMSIKRKALRQPAPADQ